MADGSAEDATEQQDTTVADDDTKKEQERIDKIIPDKPVTDEEIAELLSGEAELLKQHGVLGFVVIISSCQLPYIIIFNFQCQF